MEDKIENQIKTQIETPYNEDMKALMKELLLIVKDKEADAKLRGWAAKMMDSINDTEHNTRRFQLMSLIEHVSRKDHNHGVGKAADALSQIADVEKKRDKPSWLDDDDEE